MYTYSPTRFLFRLAALLTIILGFAMQALPAHTADIEITIGTGFNEMGPVPIGRTYRMYIEIVNYSPNPIRANTFTCVSQGTSLSASSISRLPNTVVIGVNETFYSEQYYRAVSPGTTTVICTLTGTDMVTGLPFTKVSSPIYSSLEVMADPGLSFEAYTATHVATVGQEVYITGVYHNHGKTTFTNIQFQCFEGLSLRLLSSRQNQPTVQPGQSGFVELRYMVYQGSTGSFLCSLTATDSSTQKQITLLSPFIPFTAR
jgi:hypothetical protein